MKASKGIKKLIKQIEPFENTIKTDDKNELVVELSGDRATNFDELCKLDAELKNLQARNKVLREECSTFLFDETVKLWIEKSSVSNPLVRTDVSRGVYQVRDKYTVPSNEEITENLSGSFSQEEIEKIIENEIEETVTIGFNNIDDLIADGEDELVSRLISLIDVNFTKEEKGKLLKKIEKREVVKGFLERSLEYANTRSKLKKLFSVIKPQVVISHMTTSE